jgi:hypothetical protein
MASNATTDDAAQADHASSAFGGRRALLSVRGDARLNSAVGTNVSAGGVLPCVRYYGQKEQSDQCVIDEAGISGGSQPCWRFLR